MTSVGACERVLSHKRESENFIVDSGKCHMKTFVLTQVPWRMINIQTSNDFRGTDIFVRPSYSTFDLCWDIRSLWTVFYFSYYVFFRNITLQCPMGARAKPSQRNRVLISGSDTSTLVTHRRELNWCSPVGTRHGVSSLMVETESVWDGVKLQRVTQSWWSPVAVACFSLQPTQANSGVTNSEEYSELFIMKHSNAGDYEPDSELRYARYSKLIPKLH